ncbi:molybdopterin dinucleotide binding domain-containing protein [Sphingomonas sp.]|uniref:molybdopterin dinucleotide binding domain-containing protein n=1 Tax=Sphingomonas sp. TaxID=28214 RepID=UPI003B00B3D5
MPTMLPATASQKTHVSDAIDGETANYAHVFLPGSTFLEKVGTFTDAGRAHPARPPRDGGAQWPCRLVDRAAGGECVGPRLGPPSSVRDHGRDRGQTRRTENVAWHPEDMLELHPQDAQTCGLDTGDWVRRASRPGERTLRAKVTNRVTPGVVYTTFPPGHASERRHLDFSDRVTNCPAYKVTAVR